MAQALRSTRVLTPGGLKPATLLVTGEQISGVYDWNEVSAAAELQDFGDLILFPGLVDPHVHINEPGRIDGIMVRLRRITRAFLRLRAST